jgi:hypothetical protein
MTMANFPSKSEKEPTVRIGGDHLLVEKVKKK